MVVGESQARGPIPIDRVAASSKRSAPTGRGWCSSLFFFFQAEDGIRDYKVTGVQTCALPISQGGQIGRVQVGLPGQRLPHDGKGRQPGEDAQRPQRLGLQPDRSLDPGGLGRSEERRVGKEGWISGVAVSLKKKKKEREVETSI